MTAALQFLSALTKRSRSVCRKQLEPGKEYKQPARTLSCITTTPQSSLLRTWENISSKKHEGYNKLITPKIILKRENFHYQFNTSQCILAQSITAYHGPATIKSEHSKGVSFNKTSSQDSIAQYSTAKYSPSLN